LPYKDKQIFREYLRTAKNKLESAEILFSHDKFEDAVSRAYYSVFHCAQVLLLSMGIKAESHSGVRQLFGLHFIKEGRLDKRFGRYLKNLKDERENGDYGIFTLIEKEDAQLAIEEAKEFIETTEDYLKRNKLL